MAKLSSGKLNKKAEFVTVILAGGSGTRFWPLSRCSNPKQFLKLAPDGSSLIQATANRLAPLAKSSELLVVTAQNQTPLVKEHLASAQILSEPMPKNTAACIAYAAAKVLTEVGDVPMICLPADHLISGDEELLRTFKRALELTKSNDLLATIGIPPLYPETGYGYIRKGEVYEDKEHIYKVHSFVEKPNLHLAKEYLSSADYFWNSGMFIWRAGVIWKAFKELMPNLAPHLDQMLELAKQDFPTQETTELFKKFESISIDYGVMEKAHNVVMLAGVGFRWSDVGSWSSWKDSYEESRPSDDKNLVFGEASLINCKDTLIYGDKKFIAGVGLESMIVVDTPDAILVCRRDQAQEVRKIVELLKEKGKDGLI
jgi:mannose-1-phosphate guanylyltransferase